MEKKDLETLADENAFDLIGKEWMLVTAGNKDKEEYSDILQFCGTKSGRDVDKVKETGLRPVALESGAMTFGQSRLTLDCRKLFKSSMAEANFIDRSVLEKWYGNKPGGSLHDVYVVEIENVFA